MLKVGLIGNGKISDVHKEAYRLNPDVSLEVYCDANPNNLQGLGDARTYTSVDEMLEKEQGKLDFVDICLPTFLHAETTVKALEKGFHVFCEKPMARTAEDARKMLETARRTGKTLMIGQCNRFYAPMEEMYKLIRSGELGKVRSAEFYREGSEHIESFSKTSWFYNGQLSGGGMLDTHIHDVDLIRWLFGKPKAVSAAAASVYTRDGYDAVSTNYYYDNGMFVHAQSDWTITHDKYNTRTTRINFERGYIFADRTPGRQAFVKVTEDGQETDLSHLLAFNGYIAEINYFVDCLKTGKPVEMCPPEQSADAVEIIMAEMRSADAGGERIAL